MKLNDMCVMPVLFSCIVLYCHVSFTKYMHQKVTLNKYVYDHHHNTTDYYPMFHSFQLKTSPTTHHPIGAVQTARSETPTHPLDFTLKTTLTLTTIPIHQTLSITVSPHFPCYSRVHNRLVFSKTTFTKRDLRLTQCQIMDLPGVSQHFRRKVSTVQIGLILHISNAFMNCFVFKYQLSCFNKCNLRTTILCLTYLQSGKGNSGNTV